MKKWFIAVSLCLLTIPMSVFACGDQNENDVTSVPEVHNETIEKADTNRTIKYEKLCVDVQVNNDGFYSLVSDTEIQYDGDEIQYIYLINPTLLSFQVSSENEGLWILNKERGEDFINRLNTIKDEMDAKNDTKLIEQLESIISDIEDLGPITGAST